MRVSAILLAAGRSQRMGTQKALIPWGAGTLLDYQLAQLAVVDDVREIVVVTGFHAELLAPAIERIPNARAAHTADYEDGKSTSVRCGLDAMGGDAEASLLLAVDQPRPAFVLRRLVEAHSATSQITAPYFEGHRGHPLIFSATLLPELKAIDEATLGVRAVVERHIGEVNRVNFADPVVRLDLNTPGDIEPGRTLFGFDAEESGR